ncbi:hypothetical protein KFL_016880010, partial [Klebsormidium nitens]
MMEMKSRFEEESGAQKTEIAALKKQLNKAEEEIAKLRGDAAALGKSVGEFGSIVKEKAFPNPEPQITAAKVVEEVKRTVSQVVDEQVWETVERKSRVRSIRITGLEETPGEDPNCVKDKVIALFRDRMKIANAADLVETAARVGQKKQADGHPRTVLVKVLSEQGKRRILMAKPRLRGLQVGVDEDRTPRQQAEHFRLVKLMKDARAEKKHARIVGGRLFVNGVLDLFLCLAYLPPDGSTWYQQIGTSIEEIFEQVTQDAAVAMSLGEVLLAGDLNARTSSFCDWLDMGDIELFAGVSDVESSGELEFTPPRASEDKVVNRAGRLLLEFCKAADCRILNGRVQGDEAGSATCFPAGGGSSLVDVFVASASLAQQADKLVVSDALPDSDHRMVTLGLRVGDQLLQEKKARTKADASLTGPKFSKVKEEGIPVFKAMLANSTELQALAENLEAMGPGEAATVLENAIRSAGLCAFPSPSSRKEFATRSPIWFDGECKAVRKRFLDALKAGGASHLSSQLKKEYRKIVRRKKRAFNKYRAAKLEDQMQNSPASFWKQFQKRAQGLGREHEAGLLKHCQSLYSQSETGLASAGVQQREKRRARQGGRAEESLEVAITEAEVKTALRSLKNGKSPDLGGFTAELLKAGEDHLLQVLTGTFNRVFDEGVFPDSWNEGALVAIFKKGDPADYGNYRTVTVGPVLGKLYAAVVNRRLTEWAEKEQVRARGQAGFRKGFRGADHMLALRVLTERWGR